ncbi:MAG: hypothetical protein JKY37_31780, partial [Nannocystaceae bacterium]|nr:hypothetical protein [Nannocystaceae bacterium]
MTDLPSQIVRGLGLLVLMLVGCGDDSTPLSEDEDEDEDAGIDVRGELEDPCDPGNLCATDLAC